MDYEIIDKVFMKRILTLTEERDAAYVLLRVFIKDYEEGLTAYDTEWLYNRAKKIIEGDDDE